jgi:putative glutamine amidotransferase
LLSGGYDCDPCLFGEEKLNESVEIDSRRDEWELPLVRAAVERGMPILAICRGIQSLNVALGGTLYQDLPAQMPTDIHHRQTEGRAVATHSIEVDPNSRLAAIIGPNMEVNSFHHQSLKRIADGLRVVASAPDGVIEAVEGTGEEFLIGVQFHPEEMVSGSRQAYALFEALTAAASATTRRD